MRLGLDAGALSPRVLRDEDENMLVSDGAELLQLDPVLVPGAEEPVPEADELVEPVRSEAGVVLVPFDLWVVGIQAIAGPGLLAGLR
jgi:hypothetical protein